MTIRVLNLTSSPRGIGGVERLLLDSAGRYDAARFRVGYSNLFCAEDGRGVFATALRAKGVEYHHVPGMNSWDLGPLVARLVALLRRERIQILHVHMLHATLAGVLAGRLAGVPVTVVTRHYGDEGYANHGKVIRMLDGAATRAATHVVAVSKAVRMDLVERDGLPAGFVSVIHNGIDLGGVPSANPGAPRRWGTGGPLLGTVGSLTARKGHADLLRAMPRLLAKWPDVHLVIVGEGPERPALTELASQLGISRSVTFAGFQKNVSDVLSTFDLYVHPSRAESFGIAVLEAMAARRGIVATMVGGIPDIVVPDKTGVLVPPSNPEALATAIESMLIAPATVVSMGEQGYQRVVDEFNVDRTVERYQALYEQLLAGSS